MLADNYDKEGILRKDESYIESWKGVIPININKSLSIHKRNKRFLNVLTSGRFISVFLLIGLLIFVVHSYLSGGIIGIIFQGNISTEEKLVLIKEYFLSCGTFAPFVYTIIVIIEVIVAPVPGAILYIPGGIIFGGLIGGSTALIGNVIGAGVSCQIMKILGKPALESHVNMDALRKYNSLLDKRGIWIILLLRLNPFTSSDLVSYAAGLSSMTVWKVMLGTYLGIAPLCYVQSYLAENLFDAFPLLIYPLIIVCILYALFVIWILMKVRNKNAKNIS